MNEPKCCISECETNPTHTSTNSSSRESQATALVKIAQKAHLFHDGEDCFAAIEICGHLENHALPSRPFRRWLAQEYFRAHQQAPNADALNAAINTIAGLVMFKSNEQRAFVRLATFEDRLYLDLCNPTWSVVEIGSDGWRLIESKACPVRFRRAHGMKALPDPKCGGSIAMLREFLNVATEDDFMLLIAWLVASHREQGPFPMLVLHGEQGSAKSTTARVLRDLVDPNAASLRAEPMEARHLMISANNGWVAAFDNISRIPGWLSDALCRLATGGGFAARTLYTDREETIFDAQRPALMTGIEELVVRGDLLDRAVIISLPRIPASARQTESLFYRRFHAVRPLILGALLDAVSCSLRNVTGVRLDRIPRMADFAVWIEAASPALGWKSGAFLDAYDHNRRRANDVVLEAPVVEPLRKIALPWTGTATELLNELERLACNRARRAKSWPRSAWALSNVLRRLAPNLRTVGADIEFTRQPHTGNRLIILRATKRKPIAAPPSSLN